MQGNLETKDTAPSLEEKVFFKPKFNMNPLDQTKYMIVDKDKVSFDGSECNKIGTSFKAFNTQQNACDLPGSSCLGN